MGFISYDLVIKIVHLFFSSSYTNKYSVFPNRESIWESHFVPFVVKMIFILYSCFNLLKLLHFVLKQ